MTTLSVHGKRRCAFTLLELMIVVVVLGILMGLLLPAFFKINERARIQRARLAVTALGTAIRTYHTRHGEWPADWDSFDGVDHRYGEPRHPHYKPNHLVADLLFDPPDGGPALLERKHFEMDGDENLLNPFRSEPDWKRQYSIWMDMNYDGRPEGGLQYWVMPQVD